MKIILKIYILSLFLITGCTIPDQTNSPTRKVYEMEYEWPTSTVIQLEKDLKIIKDLEQGFIKAKTENKPILMVFNAVGCVACRKFEKEISEDEHVLSLMKNNYVNVWLWVDDKKQEWKKWSDLQFREFKGNSQPHIFVLDQNGNVLGGDIMFWESKQELFAFLQEYSN